jgi:hypothetical protein
LNTKVSLPAVFLRVISTDGIGFACEPVPDARPLREIQYVPANKSQQPTSKILIMLMLLNIPISA